MEQKIKFPRSQKVYLPGKLYPNIRVAMRKSGTSAQCQL